MEFTLERLKREEEGEGEDEMEEVEAMVDMKEEDEFMKQWEKHQKKVGGIIALKGPPSSGKTIVAKLIGKWAKCPVLCIQDFFLDGEEDDDNMKEKKMEEGVQKAFTYMRKVAKRNLSREAAGSSTVVVIKSRLDSTFELERLQELSVSTRKKYPLLIIECRMGNEYLWQQRVTNFAKKYGGDEHERDVYNRWFRPRSWIELEKLRDEYYSFDPISQALAKDTTIVRRLVVDPYDDIFLAPPCGSHGLPEDFIHAIKYLLTAPKRESLGSQNLSDLRPTLFDKRLSFAASKGKSNNLCAHGDCVFKALKDYNDESTSCGKCGNRVSGEAYTCHLCTLVLHKVCAEKIDLKALDFSLRILSLRYYDDLLPTKHACKSCTDEGKDFSRECGSCVLQTHLKCGPLPTIINHNYHQHFLSILLSLHGFGCKACGHQLSDYAYCCKKYGFYYHLECAFLPIQVMKHKHGGYEHPMELKNTHHGMEQEEAYWCDVCYKDMNPQHWFYSCLKCPHFSAHVNCTTDYYPKFRDLEAAKFVQQIQSQLEVAVEMEERSKADSEIRSKE